MIRRVWHSTVECIYLAPTATIASIAYGIGSDENVPWTHLRIRIRESRSMRVCTQWMVWQQPRLRCSRYVTMYLPRWKSFLIIPEQIGAADDQIPRLVVKSVMSQGSSCDTCAARGHDGGDEEDREQMDID